MNGLLPTAVGLTAGALSSWSYVPQIMKVWRYGDTEAISVRMFALRSFGMVLWSIYGFGIGSMPVLAFGVLSLVLSTTILALKLRRPKAVHPA
jgi:MtN3 and saliva related transmembrane protein